MEKAHRDRWGREKREHGGGAESQRSQRQAYRQTPLHQESQTKIEETKENKSHRGGDSQKEKLRCREQ